MLRVHFLNVGHGECTIVEHPSGRISMIDINNSQDYDKASWEEYATAHRAAPAGYGLLAELLLKSNAQKELTDPVDFMKSKYPNRRLFRFVLTHPDMDHMRGLARLQDEVGFDNFWDVQHTKSVSSFRSDADKVDWQRYQRVRTTRSAAGPHFFLRGHRAFAFAQDEHGVAGGDNIEILSPTAALVASCNAAKTSNDLSYVLRIAHAGRTVLLTGDIENGAWCDLEHCYGKNLRADVLQASHHGRDSGFHAGSLKHIAPATIVVSVGRKPETDASSKYASLCSQVLSTRWYGNLTLEVDDAGGIRWLAQRNGKQT